MSGDKKTKKLERTEMISKTLTHLREIRRQIDPEILKSFREKVIQKPQEPDVIKIDREKNTRFVMDFLNSPAGAHLKDKIFD